MTYYDKEFIDMKRSSLFTRLQTIRSMANSLNSSYSELEELDSTSSLLKGVSYSLIVELDNCVDDLGHLVDFYESKIEDYESEHRPCVENKEDTEIDYTEKK